MSKRAILVTGFEPYAGRGLNPAFEAMKALDGRTIASVPVAGRGLPVAFALLKPAISRILDEVDPVAVVSLGLAPGEALIRLERIAVNIIDYDIPDNTGLLICDAPVSAVGNHGWPATLPLRAIERALLEAGIPARLSASAGTFLCNACLYWFLEVLAHRPVAVPCGFIHLPYVPEQAAQMLAAMRADKRLERHPASELASMELSRMIAAIEIAIKVAVREIASAASGQTLEQVVTAEGCGR